MNGSHRDFGENSDMKESEANLRDALFDFFERRESLERIVTSEDPTGLEGLVNLGVAYARDLIREWNDGVSKLERSVDWLGQ